MQIRTWIHILRAAYLITVMVAIIVTLWSLLPHAALLATVSWNG